MGDLKIIWSYILDYENEQNPFEERKSTIQEWKQFAILDLEENNKILEKARELVKKDLSCSIAAGELRRSA